MCYFAGYFVVTACYLAVVARFCSLLGGYWWLLGGYCPLLTVTVHYHSLLFVSTFSVNEFLQLRLWKCAAFLKWEVLHNLKFEYIFHLFFTNAIHCTAKFWLGFKLYMAISLRWNVLRRSSYLQSSFSQKFIKILLNVTLPKHFFIKNDSITSFFFRNLRSFY